MSCRTLKFAFVLATVVAVGMPQLAVHADEPDAERLLEGIANGILQEYMPRQYRPDDYRHGGVRPRGRHYDIPAGHYPPPGSCRIWYPDRPAGHQPPPTSCNVRVPRGAFLVRG